MRDLSGHRSVQVVSVGYAANSVTTLVRPWVYFANLAKGVSAALAAVNKQASACPNEQIVLAGYSQGAMVMHRLLHQLSPAIVQRVAAALLVADGDQMPNDQQTRYGTAPLGALGAGHVWSKVSHSSTARFPASLRTRVLSVCNRHDPVCDIRPYTTWDPALVTIHLGYAGKKPELAATDEAAMLTRSLPLPSARTVRLQATASAPFIYQLLADTAPGSTLQWGLNPPSVTPPGLSVSSSGLIKGAPASPGTVGFLVRVRSLSRTFTSSWVPLQVDISIAPRPAATWTAAQARMPADAAPGGILTSAACPSVSFCAAIGRYSDTAGQPQAVLEWGPRDQPGGWTAAQPPLPADAATPAYPQLSGISCRSANLCVVVGEYANTTGYYRGLVLTWTGSAWTAAQAPLPPGTPTDAATPVSVQLFSAACESASLCVAVGTYSIGTSGSTRGPFGFIVEGSGPNWTALDAPRPPGGSADTPTNLAYIACGDTACLAVGSSNGDGGLELVHGGHGTWSNAAVTMPADSQEGFQQPAFTSAACTPTGQCQAVGTYLAVQPNGSRLVEGLAVHGTGPNWQGTQLPLPANRASLSGDNVLAARPASVACPDSGGCVTVGGYAVDLPGPGSSLLYQGLLEAGGAAESPIPAGSNASYGEGLQTVACPAADSCTAVGSYTSDTLVNGRPSVATATVHALIVTGTGQSWTALEPPAPAGAQSGSPALWSLTCPGPTSCTVIGVYEDQAGVQHGYLLTSSP